MCIFAALVKSYMKMHSSWKVFWLVVYRSYFVVSFHISDVCPASAMLLTMYMRTCYRFYGAAGSTEKACSLCNVFILWSVTGKVAIALSVCCVYILLQTFVIFYVCVHLTTNSK